MILSIHAHDAGYEPAEHVDELPLREHDGFDVLITGPWG